MGTYIPVPGIDAIQLKNFFEQASSGIGGMLNMFTGGAVGRMAIFALGIMPIYYFVNYHSVNDSNGATP